MVENKEQEILVSICCIAYNQEKYIKETLDGFISQETDFKYEVIVHDDASLDKTADIIREYERRYPEIFKGIYQIENQYSKGEKILQKLFEKCRGKYIAICEGDDYWNNPKKLQKQIEYMENNSDCGLTFHNGLILDDITKRTKVMVPLRPEDKKFMKKNNKYDAGDILLIGFVPTASCVFRRETIINPPKFFINASVGDLPIRLISTNYGYAYYFDEPMCVYRRNTNISLCDKFDKSDINTKINDLNKIIEIVDEFDEYSNYKYTEKINVFKKFYDIKKYELQNDYKKMIDREHKKYYKMLGKKHRFKIFLNRHLPFVVKNIKKIKQFLINKKIISKWI